VSWRGSEIHSDRGDSATDTQSGAPPSKTGIIVASASFVGGLAAGLGGTVLCWYFPSCRNIIRTDARMSNRVTHLDVPAEDALQAPQMPHHPAANAHAAAHPHPHAAHAANVQLAEEAIHHADAAEGVHHARVMGA